MTDVEKLKASLMKDFVIQADKNFLELIQKVKDHIQIDQNSGPIIQSEKANKLNQLDKVELVLLAVRAGKYLNVWNTDSMRVDEISGKTGIASNVAQVRVSGLVKQNIVVNLVGTAGKAGAYRLSDYGVQHFEKTILPKLTGESSIKEK